jgi:transketolase
MNIFHFMNIYSNALSLPLENELLCGVNNNQEQTMLSDLELKAKSAEYRKTILRIIKQAHAGHTGGDLSSIDILNVLYNHTLCVSPQTFADPNHDRYVQSKGHCVEALYTVLADRGFFPVEELDTLCKYRSRLIGHPTRGVPGIEQNTGALGHGLAVAVGMAIAAKLDQRSYRVFTLLGDGELDEGSNWEASMAASHYHLDNLMVIVDRNGLQITGSTEMVNPLEPLAEKFRAFGFAVREVDGNDTSALVELFDQFPFEPGKPNLVLAHTIKGKGVSFIENSLKWHHRVPNDEEYDIALQELDLTYELDEGR